MLDEETKDGPKCGSDIGRHFQNLGKIKEYKVLTHLFAVKKQTAFESEVESWVPCPFSIVLRRQAPKDDLGAWFPNFTVR